MKPNELQADAAIRVFARENGVDLVGYSAMTEQTYLRGDCAQHLLHQGYRQAITLACSISVSACELLFKQEDPGFLFYFTQHTKSRAEQLEQAAQKLCIQIESLGYRAFLVPGLGTAYHDGGCPTILSHITQARLAGLGTMGDSGMLLTPQFGPRVRLATVLTDCPLPVPEMLLGDLCLHCGACAAICPAGSITPGRHFDSEHPERYYTDKLACARYRDGNKEKYGSRFCNLCMAACPVGRNAHCGGHWYSFQG